MLNSNQPTLVMYVLEIFMLVMTDKHQLFRTDCLLNLQDY